MDKLDRYDLNILAELQRNAALSNQELAERIGLSPSPCSRRVKQLEDDGYITGQVALLDRKKLGLSLTAYVLIGMDRHTPERFEHFQDEIRKCPEVLECCLVTGMDAASAWTAFTSKAAVGVPQSGDGSTVTTLEETLSPSTVRTSCSFWPTFSLPVPR